MCTSYRSFSVETSDLQYGRGGWVSAELCTENWMTKSTTSYGWNALLPGGQYKFQMGKSSTSDLVIYICPTNDCTNYFTNTWIGTDYSALMAKIWFNEDGKGTMRTYGSSWDAYGFSTIGVTACPWDTCWQYWYGMTDGYYEFTVTVDSAKWMWVKMQNHAGPPTPDLYFLLTSLNCNAGSYGVSGATACTTCTAGYQCPSVGMTAATVCLNGTYSNSGQSACTPCAPGSFSGRAAAACTPCTPCTAGNGYFLS